jgi:ornithine cyclodeaminase/alanine dehydrogenase-like protein (mu-crystallin family)
MRALIVGSGSIGKRHLRNLRATMPTAEITVWRQHGKSENDVELHPQTNGFVYSLDDAINIQPEIALAVHESSRLQKTVVL